MTDRGTVKATRTHPRLVGVIASLADLRSATRLRRPPDLFELRLDALYPVKPAAQRLVERLPRPLIVTARHPREGGRNALTTGQRRELLLRFLDGAAFVDLELRACQQLRAVLDAATERGIPRILSVHDLRRTPALRDLEALMRRAEELSASVFKLVTLTDHAAELARLLAFFDKFHARFPLCVMGVGRLGLESRRALWRRGSLLHYVHLGTAVVPGQFSLAAARRLPAPSAVSWGLANPNRVLRRI